MVRGGWRCGLDVVIVTDCAIVRSIQVAFCLLVVNEAITSQEVGNLSYRLCSPTPQLYQRLL